MVHSLLGGRIEGKPSCHALAMNNANPGQSEPNRPNPRPIFHSSTNFPIRKAKWENDRNRERHIANSNFMTMLQSNPIRCQSYPIQCQFQAIYEDICLDNLGTSALYGMVPGLLGGWFHSSAIQSGNCQLQSNWHKIGHALTRIGKSHANPGHSEDKCASNLLNKLLYGLLVGLLGGWIGPIWHHNLHQPTANPLSGLAQHWHWYPQSLPIQCQFQAITESHLSK